MIKKILIFVVVVVLGLGILGACAGGSDNSGSGSNEEQQKQEFTLEGDIETSMEYDMPKFTGTIKNNTDSEKSYVEIEFVLYDSEDTQVGTALANTTTLKAGGTWKFEATSIDPSAAEYDHYEYTISGY